MRSAPPLRNVTWAEGYQPGIPAGTFDAELRRASARLGAKATVRLQAEALVARAARPSSPLHPILFDKTDAEEAYESRIGRACDLVRGLRVAEVGGQATVAPVRAWVAVSTSVASGPRAYLPIGQAISDVQARAELLERGWREVGSAVARQAAMLRACGDKARADHLEKTWAEARLP